MASVLVVPPPFAGRVVLADQRGQQRVRAERVVVVEILIAESQALDPLSEQLLDHMIDSLGPAVVGEAGGHSLDEAEAAVDLLEQEPTTVAADATGAEVELDAALAGQRQVELRVGGEDRTLLSASDRPSLCGNGAAELLEINSGTTIRCL